MATDNFPTLICRPCPVTEDTRQQWHPLEWGSGSGKNKACTQLLSFTADAEFGKASKGQSLHKEYDSLSKVVKPHFKCPPHLRCESERSRTSINARPDSLNPRHSSSTINQTPEKEPHHSSSNATILALCTLPTVSVKLPFLLLSSSPLT